jgi:hypothetical protein
LPEDYYTEASATQNIADKIKPNGENNGWSNHWTCSSNW